MIKKSIYLVGLVAALILSGCTKKTIIEETITVVGEGPAEIDYYGVWELQSTVPNSEKKYYVFEKGSVFGLIMTEDQYGFRRKRYQTVLVTSTMFRVAGEQDRPYKLEGDTLTFLGGWDGPDERSVYVKITDGSVTADNWVKDLTVSRTVKVPGSTNYSPNTQNSFGIDGDFIYINARPTGTYKFYKLNTLNGTFVDSVNAPVNTWHALYYKSSSNKLYHTRNSSGQTMRQRTGINGADANLSTNSLSIRAISVNGTSGTVYGSYNNQLYSGSEGGSFSSLFTFTGNYPYCKVYYKSDQFLGVYNNTLIQFEISPSFKIIGQYTLPNGQDIYQSIATNGSDIWLVTYNYSTDYYEYKKVSLN